ncbi:YHS domain-containing (seleno)protein [Paracoccus pacificus]|uniref:YHS domain-containing (Seleno)protein n=1 Tax=Paracoccus pacificus TaxID=1463598 RepID=A0ABW4RA59_9RHOB
MMKIQDARAATLLILSTIAAFPAVAEDWALDGIDPVTYHSMNRAVPGRSDISTQWAGESWHFADEANRAAFEANPRAYVPAMGGYCVVALSEGRMEPGNPRLFVMIGDRVYLTRTPENQDRLQANPGPILKAAKKNWDKIK